MKKEYLNYIIIFAVLFSVVGAAALCSEIVIEKHGNVTNYISKQDPVNYAENVLNKTDSEKRELLDYVMNNPEKVTPITYMALADYIYKTNKDDALFWFYVGSLRAYEDLHMCTDESAWAQVQIYPLLAPQTANYSGTLSDEARNKLTEKALQWDEAHPDRVNPKWACYHGMDVFSNGDVTIKPMSEYLKVQKEFREKIRNSFNDN